VVVERFGADAVRSWWFEVWNEPNMPPFWDGSFERYLELYRATSEAVVASGYEVRLGGPAAAYTPPEGASLMERFIAFLAKEPAVKCDFLSLHRKGIWGPEDAGGPRMERLIEASERTAETALRLVPERARGLAIVNNEADMKVGFDRPYEPRMTEQFPAWLSGTMAAYDALSAKYAAHGLRFVPASDDANQHLVQSPFDGRRSIMTMASSSPRDLIKVPVYNFYELLRLLGGRHGTIRTGGAAGFPHSDLFHMVTADESRIAVLFSAYAVPGPSAPRSWKLDYTLEDIPWPRVNIARFRIDATHANSYTAAGRHLAPPVVGAGRLRAVQELSVDRPIETNVALTGGRFPDTLDLASFAVVLLWITPFSTDPPAAPQWLESTVEDGNVVLRWTRSREPAFYSYEVRRSTGGSAGVRLTPMPLRAAMWIDTAPPGGTHVYTVQAVSASGISSAAVPGRPVTV
jgi:hypothetical protein